MVAPKIETEVLASYPPEVSPKTLEDKQAISTDGSAPAQFHIGVK